MRTSESINNILPLLDKACKAMSGVKKNAKNPFYESKYANLNAFLDVVKPALEAQGLFMVQPIGKDEFGTYVETMVYHVDSNEWISSRTPVLSNNTDPQKQASGITYARRYDMQSLFCLKAVDDDGSQAQEKETEEKNGRLIKPETAKKIQAELDKSEDPVLAWESVRGKIEKVEDIPPSELKRIGASIVEYLKNENS